MIIAETSPKFDAVKKVKIQLILTNCDERRIQMLVVNIAWSVDETEDLEELPVEVEVPDEVNEEDIADWLSDQYGYLIESFQY